MRMGDEPDSEASRRPRATPADDTTIASWPACVAIAIVLLALVLSLPHV